MLDHVGELVGEIVFVLCHFVPPAYTLGDDINIKSPFATRFPSLIDSSCVRGDGLSFIAMAAHTGSRTKSFAYSSLG
jgi:hypothetical protein